MLGGGVPVGSGVVLGVRVAARVAVGVIEYMLVGVGVAPVVETHWPVAPLQVVPNTATPPAAHEPPTGGPHNPEYWQQSDAPGVWDGVRAMVGVEVVVDVGTPPEGVGVVVGVMVGVGVTVGVNITH
jgi:hypothetical protein